MNNTINNERAQAFIYNFTKLIIEDLKKNGSEDERREEQLTSARQALLNKLKYNA